MIDNDNNNEPIAAAYRECRSLARRGDVVFRRVPEHASRHLLTMAVTGHA